MQIEQLSAKSVELIAQIDRSETVTYAYRVRDGALERYTVEWDIPTFRAEGAGPHSVHDQIRYRREALDNGAKLLGAFDGDAVAGLAVVAPEFEPPMAWLAYMQVSRAYRRHGIGTLLWAASEELARESGATSIYVSAIPSGPTIDFYVGLGCEPATDLHPALYAAEPEDIHLIKRW